MGVTLSSTPKAYGSTGYTWWSNEGNVVLEEAYALTSGTTYWPYVDSPELDAFDGAVIPLANGIELTKYSNYDVEQFSFLEFEIPYIDNKPILSFDWKFTQQEATTRTM